jgi:hypothetical protein
VKIMNGLRRLPLPREEFLTTSAVDAVYLKRTAGNCEAI